MATAPFLSRHLGDYLLVAQLGEDALGTVFRALYVADERRFVRLRILQSAELSPETVRLAIEENATHVLSHDAIVRQQELGLVEGVPYLAWNESAGWTLDVLLARVRGLGLRIPPEYALLIGERIAAALEHAHRALPDGRGSMSHGLLWPGFVSLSNDSEVRVGAFGLAAAVLPSLDNPRLSAEIAPYLAPEGRREAAGPSSDVYSLGAILLELLTGRRPSPEAPLADPGQEELSQELGAFLRLALAANPVERFASALDTHRALQELLTGSPYSLYTANLALFLYKLLNPESQSVAPSSDWESTNPVVVGPAAGPAAEKASSTDQDGGRQDPADASAAVGLATGLLLQEAAEKDAVQDSPEEEAARSPSDLGPEPGRAVRAPWNWTRSLAAGVGAAGIAAGLLLATRGIERPASTTAARPAPVVVEAPAVVPVTSPPAAREPNSADSAPTERPVAIDPALPPPAPGPPALAAVSRGLADRSGSQRAAAGSSRRRESAAARSRAEKARFDAAFARLAAARVEAGDLAGEVYGDARRSEQEGDRLLRDRQYETADAAFRRATRLYHQAEGVSFQERVRRVKLTSGK